MSDELSRIGGSCKQLGGRHFQVGGWGLNETEAAFNYTPEAAAAYEVVAATAMAAAATRASTEAATAAESGHAAGVWIHRRCVLVKAKSEAAAVSPAETEVVRLSIRLYRRRLRRGCARHQGRTKARAGVP